MAAIHTLLTKHLHQIRTCQSWQISLDVPHEIGKNNDASMPTSYNANESQDMNQLAIGGLHLLLDYKTAIRSQMFQLLPRSDAFRHDFFWWAST
jgi:hypothetical protein